MTALPAEPWSDHQARVADSAEEVCAGCGVVFVWRDGWDGECLECAVLTQEHRAGGHRAAFVPDCRHCS